MSKRGGISQPMSQASAGGGTSAAELEFLEFIRECLAELKLLTIANNDATALAEIIGQLSALCEKLLAQNDQTAAICKKLEKMLSELSSLCEKIENGNEDILDCLTQIKEEMTTVIETLESICEKQELLQETLESVITECPDACGASAIRGHCGRPNNLVSYSYGGVTGSTLEEFTANWEASGGKTWVANFDGVGGGECHWYCPAVGGDFIIDGEVQETVTASPNPNAEALGCVSTKALATVGCYDAQILACFQAMKEALDCPKPLTLECLKKRTFCIGYDNGRTAGSSTNDCGSAAGFVRFDWEFEVIGWEVNGQTVGAGETLGPFTGWTPQLQGWADFFNANDPNFVDGECFAEFGFLPAPTWRYTKITCCNPTAKYGPLKLRRVDDGCVYTIYPLFENDSLETVNRYATIDCDGNKDINWCDAAGLSIETPESQSCFVPCDFIFGPYVYGESVDCESEIFNVCDNGTEPTTPFVLERVVCDGAVTEVNNYTLDSWVTATNGDELVAYELVGSIVNCATGEEFEFPESLDQQILDKLCQILGDPDTDCPDCVLAKEPVVYENSDNTTELAVSVGGNGDIKITSGNGDGSDSAVVSCIESCLAAGDDVVVTWTTVDGGSGSATLLAGATTNAFPGFYNDSTDATGDSGKLLTLTCG